MLNVKFFVINIPAHMYNSFYLISAPLRSLVTDFFSLFFENPAIDDSSAPRSRGGGGRDSGGGAAAGGGGAGEACTHNIAVNHHD